MERPDVHYAVAPDGVHIAYQAFGTGRYDILCVPGQSTHLDLMWDDPEQVRFLRRLAGSGRVIIMDRRGVGLSDRLSPRDLPPVEVLADDVGVVLRASGATSPVLFGSAEGGQIAAMFAATHPNRVAGLILYATWYALPPLERQEWLEWLEWAPMRWGSEELAQLDARQMWPSRASDPWFIDYVRRLTRSALSPAAARVLYEYMLAIDIHDVLPSVTAPTLTMWREHDSTGVGVDVLRETASLIPGARKVVLPGADHWWMAGPMDPVFEAIESFLAELSGASRAETRRLATVLFTDIVESTARAAELGDADWRDVVGRHHAIVRRELGRFGGTEIDTAGDGFFATFDGPAAAVRCARAIGAATLEVGLRIRAGVHTGEVETIDGKAGGLGVLIGARIGALADPGQVWASSTVKDLSAGSGLGFEDVGERELKGVPDRWHLFRVLA